MHAAREERHVRVPDPEASGHEVHASPGPRARIAVCHHHGART
ncbi:Hypothetical protein A7982_08562 [Minicystis rosea]|nr:Hypothetical protein A7982_08562 [Minicystis rosea]